MKDKMISQRLLDELGQVLKENYGQDLKPQEIFASANTLISYFDLLMRWDSEDRLNKQNENENEQNSKGKNKIADKTH